MIRYIKPHNRRIQSHICIGDEISEQKVLAVTKLLFEAVEGGKDAADGRVIGGLAGREARAVDAIVEIGVYPCVEGVNVCD